MEQKQLYREASLKSIRSPEELNQYLRVTSLSVWLLLGAVILLLAGLLVWGSFTYIDSVVSCSAQVEDGTMTIRFEDEKGAESVQVGMRVTAGDYSDEIHSLGRDEQGLFAVAETSLADGSYQVQVHYRQTQILRLLFR